MSACFQGVLTFSQRTVGLVSAQKVGGGVSVLLGLWGHLAVLLAQAPRPAHAVWAAHSPRPSWRSHAVAREPSSLRHHAALPTASSLLRGAMFAGAQASISLDILGLLLPPALLPGIQTRP